MRCEPLFVLALAFYETKEGSISVSNLDFL